MTKLEFLRYAFAQLAQLGDEGFELSLNPGQNKNYFLMYYLSYQFHHNLNYQKWKQ